MNTAVAKQQEGRALRPVERFERKLQLAKPQFQAALLGSGIDTERFVRVSRTAVMLNPEILDCDEASIFGAFMTAAQLHFEPDPNIGHGDVLVRFVKGRKVAVWQTRYGGFVELAWRSGELMSLQVNVVHENDTFRHVRGLKEDLEHEEAEGDRGPWTKVYCVALFKSGGRHIEVMTKADVLAIRDQYSDGWKAFKAGKIKSTPWSTAETEQAKKTVVRRARKYWPRSIVDNRKMVQAEKLQAVVEAGGHGQIDGGELVYSLPDGASLDDDNSVTSEREHQEAEPAQPAQSRLDQMAAKAQAERAKAETVDPETGEIKGNDDQPGEDLFLAGGMNADAAGQVRADFVALIKGVKSVDALQALMETDDNVDLLNQLQTVSAKDFAAVMKAVDDRRAALAK